MRSSVMGHEGSDVERGEKSKRKRKTNARVVRASFNFPGAEGESRTRTGIRLLDPEPSASTNSATSACSSYVAVSHGFVKMNPGCEEARGE